MHPLPELGDGWHRDHAWSWALGGVTAWGRLPAPGVLSASAAA
jgi:hypothetical protein